jgi:hypothetical protein
MLMRFTRQVLLIFHCPSPGVMNLTLLCEEGKKHGVRYCALEMSAAAAACDVQGTGVYLILLLMRTRQRAPTLLQTAMAVKQCCLQPWRPSHGLLSCSITQSCGSSMAAV